MSDILSDEDSDVSFAGNEYASLEAELETLYASNTYRFCKPIDPYKKLKTVHKCSSCIVFKAQKKDSTDVCALKKILGVHQNMNGLDASFYRELATRDLNHRNVLPFKDVLVQSKLEQIFFVYDYCEIDLKRLLQTLDSPMPLSEVKYLTKELMNGLAYLHDKGIVHRSIAPSNLLLSSDGVLKIADFGCALKGAPLSSDSKMGELSYRAPEVLFGNKLCMPAVDIWSVGCILGEMLKNTPIFSGTSNVEVLNSIIDLLGMPNDKIMPQFATAFPLVATIEMKKQPYSKIRQNFRDFSMSCLNFLSGILIYDFEIRYNTQKCLSHAFFSEMPVPSSENELVKYCQE